jgi:hypothetical protein
VAEVFYDGAYHYFDSDMMGYNSMDSGPLKKRPVASVHQLEKDPSIILGKMTGPRQTDKTAVDEPWYPADVRGDAIEGLAELFTSTEDNWLYPFERVPHGHTMDFVLRPGERMVRSFQPESAQTFYLPQMFDGTSWREFPQEIAQYNIRTEDGPRSQKDTRSWATGIIEYRPPVMQPVFDMPSPYVIIDAHFLADVHLPSGRETVTAETSTDGGRTWVSGTALNGPFDGQWRAEPAITVKSSHGASSAVAGSYGYLVRLALRGAEKGAKISSVVLTTRFQLNPRTLPELTPGSNELRYRSGMLRRTAVPVRADKVESFASKTTNISYTGDRSQGYISNKSPEPAELIFEIAAPDGLTLTGFDAGGRFLDLRHGLAPDKFTAEVRSVVHWPAKNAPGPEASILWALRPEGPYRPLWNYDSKDSPGETA